MTHPNPDPAVCIKVPQVIGRSDCKVLVVTDIPLDPPAFEVKDIDKEVIIDQCHVDTDCVIINGRLRKNINYKTKKDCDWIDGIERVCGDVRHCTVFIPFDCFIEIEGAREDDECQVEEKEVTCEKEELRREGSILHEKAVVRVDVKVLRETQMTVNARIPGSACP